MPNRIIRDRILSSESLAALSHPAERLFYRLVVLVDDHGRFHGSPQYVRHAAMPLLEVSAADVGRWLSELAAADVICHYEEAGRRYLQFKNWPRYQRLRAKDSKYPRHEGCVCGQLLPIAVKCLPDTESDTESESDVKKEGALTRAPAKVKVVEETPEFDRVWALYPRRAGSNPRGAALESWRARRKEGVSAQELESAVERYSKFCQATGKVGTETVQQAASFFGPKKAGWRETWDLPLALPKVNGHSGTRKLKLVSGRVITVPPNKRIQYTDAPDACDAYELPNGTLSVKSGAQWVGA